MFGPCVVNDGAGRAMDEARDAGCERAAAAAAAAAAVR